MAIEIVDFPIKNGDFPIAMLNYQRVHRDFFWEKREKEHLHSFYSKILSNAFHVFF